MKIPALMANYSDRDRKVFGEALHASFDPDEPVRALEQMVASTFGINPARVIATNSCTNALAIMGKALLWFDSERILFRAPRFTWPGTYSWVPFVATRGNLLFGDVDSRDLMLNARCEMEPAPAPMVHIFVDMFGQVPPPDRILQAVGDAPFIFDSAHATFHVAHRGILNLPNCVGIAYSFADTKEIDAMRGGMAILGNYRFESDFCQYVRAFARAGTINRKKITDCGLNAHMPAPVAALILDKAPRRLEALERRSKIHAIYREELSEKWGLCGTVRYGSHLCTLELPSIKLRQRVCRELEQVGIGVGHHYPVAEWFQDQPEWNDYKISRRILTLPSYWQLTSLDQQRVISAILHANARCHLSTRA